MKRYIYLFPFLFIIGPLIYSWFHSGFHQNHDESDKIAFCKNADKASQALPPSLISSSSDSEDLVLCPGNSLGDPNDTYITVTNCYLNIYHKEKLIWSSKSNERYAGHINDNEYACALSLQRDGNLVLYQESVIYANPGGRKVVILTQWESQTSLNPHKTELKVQDQQMKIIQTFRDGSERLFYVGEENQDFKEDMGEPKKIAKRFVLKKSEDKDKVILRRNEYIGDLDGTHLILQTDCHLQLLNQNKILWSFAPQIRHEMSCVLDIDHRYQVSISHKKPRETSQEIMHFGEYYDAIQTLISFEDDQPMIIQTLRNGTKLIFTSGIRQYDGLQLKREPRQIAKKRLEIFQERYQDYQIDKMDYIGDLNGLHLIFQQNCSLMLINGGQKLWELRRNLRESPLRECFIRFDQYGNFLLNIQYCGFYTGGQYILTLNYDERSFLAGYKLSLENNHLILERQFTNRASDVYFAGPDTHGTFAQIISEHSVVVDEDNKDERVLPKMSFIGNLNGFYAMLQEDCNWVFYDRAQIIWESGTARNEGDQYCVLILKRNGSLVITHEWEHRRENDFWSTQDITSNSEKEVLRTKLFVDDGGLWLINDYADGVEKRFQALEGTNNFIQKGNNI